MSDREDDSLAACGSLGSRARRTADCDDDSHCPCRKSDFPSDYAVFERCNVKSQEVFPRHIYLLFLVLGIQFRWVLKRSTLARDDDDVFYLFLGKTKNRSRAPPYLEEGTYHKRLFRGPNTNDMKK